MDVYILLAIRIIIGTIFLSSAIHKLSNMTEHIVVVRQYKILPTSLIRPFSFWESLIELAAASLLIVGFYVKVTGIVLIFLLFIYSSAIIINLLRSNIDISCGCGGLVGNHKLNWSLIGRNLLITLFLLLIVIKSPHIFSVDSLLQGIETYNKLYIFLTLASSILIMLGYSIGMSLVNIRKLSIELIKKEGRIQ